MRPRVAWSIALACGLAPGAARAQEWAVHRFHPTPGGDLFFAADHPRYTGTSVVMARFGVISDYAYLPAVRFEPDGTSRPVIEHALSLHAQGTLALLNRVDVGFSTPFRAVESGPPASPGVTIAAQNAPSVSDGRIGLRVRILGDAERDPISLHVGAQLHLWFLGIGRQFMPATESQVRGRFYVVLAGREGSFRWSLQGGYAGRPSADVDTHGTRVGSEAFVTAGVAWLLLGDRLAVGPEFWASTVTERAFQRGHLGAELLLGAHYTAAETFRVGLGLATGFGGEVGIPATRVLVQLAYAPEPRRPQRPRRPLDADRDGVIDAIDFCVGTPAGARRDRYRPGCPLRDADSDGVGDRDDLCVDTPRGETPDPLRAGCPAPDRDGDGVPDTLDVCAITPRGDHADAARAGCPDGDDDADGVRNGEDACIAQHRGPYEDAARRGCPLADRDSDGVPDARDGCPEQPGPAHPDPARSGCPGVISVAGGVVRVLEPVSFAQGSSEPDAAGARAVDAVAALLRASPDIDRVAVVGQRDAGTRRDDGLALRRAESVVRLLVARGVEASRLTARAGSGPRASTARHGVEFQIVRGSAASGAVRDEGSEPAPASGATR